MINIIDLLKENKDVTFYKVRIINTVSHELFFVHRNLETVRATDTTTTYVTIYNSHDGKIGNADFIVYGSDDEKIIKEKIESAVSKTKVINNEYYTLPEKSTKSVKVKSNFEGKSLASIAESVSEAIYSANINKDGDINALEIFINLINERIINSNGLDKSMERYEAIVEDIPTWNGENFESVELYNYFKFNELNKDEIKNIISSKMKEVEYRFKAKKPDSPIKMKVCLRAEELNNIMDELAYEASASSIYQKLNVYKIGDKIQKGNNYDPLYVDKVASIKGSAYSREFDEDGVDLIDTPVIVNGKYKNIFGSNRFSKYLGITPTGDLPCTLVKSGSLDINDVNEYFEVVSMSGLQLELYSDYVGGEVRLGLIHRGKEIIPVTGISISAKLSEILSNMRLSKDIVTKEDYRGPNLALFDGFEIQ